MTLAERIADDPDPGDIGLDLGHAHRIRDRACVLVFLDELGRDTDRQAERLRSARRRALDEGVELDTVNDWTMAGCVAGHRSAHP